MRCQIEAADVQPATPSRCDLVLIRLHPLGMDVGCNAPERCQQLAVSATDVEPVTLLPQVIAKDFRKDAAIAAHRCAMETSRDFQRDLTLMASFLCRMLDLVGRRGMLHEQQAASGALDEREAVLLEVRRVGGRCAVIAHCGGINESLHTPFTVRRAV